MAGEPRVAAQGDDIVPLAGARRRDRLKKPSARWISLMTSEDLGAVEVGTPKDIDWSLVGFQNKARGAKQPLIGSHFAIPLKIEPFEGQYD